ncbi:24428_t:CDS:1, partial [Gigaspora rosea]
LKEKRHVRSMKDVVLVDLQENSLHTMEEYIKAINVVTEVPSIRRYIEHGYAIPLVADWPGQIHLRTAISHYLCYNNASNITHD